MSVTCKATISQNMKDALNAFQIELNIFNNYLERPVEAKNIAKKHIENNPDLEFVNGWGTPMGVLEELNEQFQKNNCSEKKQHGGKRTGAGRKKKEKTVVMRIPESLKESIEEIIKKHKEQNQ